MDKEKLYDIIASYFEEMCGIAFIGEMNITEETTPEGYPLGFTVGIKNKVDADLKVWYADLCDYLLSKLTATENKFNKVNKPNRII